MEVVIIQGVEEVETHLHSVDIVVRQVDTVLTVGHNMLVV